MSSSIGSPKPPLATGYPAPPAGAAYPYPAPPPQSYYPSGAPPPPNPHYYPPAYAPPPPRYNAVFLRRLLSIVVPLFVLFFVVVLIIWLALRPRLPEVSVSSAAVSGFNLSALQQQQLFADFDLNFTIHNPNVKMGIYYDRLTAFVLYGSDTISETSLAPFYQAKGDTTAVRARLVAAGGYVDSDVVKGINSDRGDGAVGFNIRVWAWVRFRSGAWRTRWHVLEVYCDDVMIGFKNGTNAAAAGYLVGSTPKNCVANL
ncbi:hypothetical protein Cni_G20634 [Canna indica]|uniref:Late embryogenesis abundant protein LEA-2 subgroup domain-containing protein n=1 Tax=Canna indica TaxID=4628 RepID=A0AAQ3KPF5_9LILI|nr:hypothetical protein Cni_G20634 [Canna indica]